MANQITIDDLHKSRHDQLSKVLSTDSSGTAIKSENFLKNLTTDIENLTFNLGQKYSPFINGYYIIYMQSGSWINEINNENVKEYLSEADFSGLSVTDLNKDGNTLNSFSKKVFPMLATDIELPEVTKEYLNISSRAQSITHYHRETTLPDFSLSYIENQDLQVIRYHSLWHKIIELYRRGVLSTNKIRTGGGYKMFFYEVPYVNNVWTLVLDVKFQIRGLILLTGVKPVSFPLRQFLGNRSQPKLTVYNISYKSSQMFYNFYKDTKHFLEQADTNDKDRYQLAKAFKSFYTTIQ